MRSGLVLFLLLSVFLISGSHAAPPEPPAEIPVVEIPGGGDGNGELALLDLSGKTVRRYTHLGDPVHLVRSGTDTFIVTDLLGRRLIEIDLEGTVRWSWTLRAGTPTAESVSILPEGRLLVTFGRKGVVEIDRTGEILWRAPTPIRDKPVRRAVRLWDGSTLLTVQDRALHVFVIPAGQSEGREIPIPVSQDHCNLLRATGFTPEGREVLLWDNDWTAAYRLAWDGERLELVETFLRHRALLEVVPLEQGGWLFSRADMQVGFRLPGQEPVLVKTLFQANAVAPTSGLEGLLIGYQRLEDGVWPDSRPAPPEESALNVSRFWIWIGVAALAGGLLLALDSLRKRRKTGASSAKDTPTDSESLSKSDKADSFRPRLRGIRLWALTTAACLLTGLGLYVAHAGYTQMQNRLQDPWLTLLATGTTLSVLTLEAWRRFVLHRPDAYWKTTKESMPTGSSWLSPVLGAVMLSAGAVLLFYWSWNRQHYSDRVGLWAGLILFSVLISLSPLIGKLRRAGPRLKTHLPLIAIPLILAAFTFGYRLREIPPQYHGDSVCYALHGLDLLEGRIPDIWHYGSYPWPVIGHAYEAIGIVLAGGFGTLGVRLGSVLYCLTAIPAVYLLGWCYRDRRTGFLAAVLLAGSITFLHCARINYPGEAATASLWCLTLFALAVQRGHPSLWILSGLAAAHCFFLYASSRPAPLAIACWGFAIALRAPRKVTLPRWFGPILLVVVVLACLAPILPTYIQKRGAALPRAEQVMTVYKPSEGVNWTFLRQSFGRPLASSFGWFFTVPDRSSQGTLSPALNEFEGILLLLGAGICLVEGFSLNLLFLGYIFLVLVTCGAWAVGPPWTIRLLPTIPVATVLMARGLTGILDIFRAAPRWLGRGGLFAAAVAAIVSCSVLNFRTYVRYETGHTKYERLREMSAIGWSLVELGHPYQYYMVITGRPDWSCDWTRRTARLHELLPFIWNLHIKEVRDLQSRLPFPENPGTVVIVQDERYEEDVTLLRQWYPQARIQEVRGQHGDRWAALAIVESASE